MTDYRRHYSEQDSRRYQSHTKPAKHAAEMRLIDRVTARIPQEHKILDVPSGAGRIVIRLLGKGFNVTGADISEEMLKLARGNLDRMGYKALVEYQDLEKLTYPDRAFDTTLCFQLFHHLPSPQLRQTIIVSELCRVSDKSALLSHRSPWSFSSLNLN